MQYTTNVTPILKISQHSFLYVEIKRELEVIKVGCDLKYIIFYNLEQYHPVFNIMINQIMWNKKRHTIGLKVVT